MEQEHQIDQYGATVSRIMRSDGVIVYRISATDRTSIDSWKRACVETNAESDTAQTVRSLHNIDDVGGLITPYANQRIREVMQDSAHLKGYTAIVIRRSLTVALIELIWRQLSRFNQSWDMRIFFQEDEGIAWLLAQPDK